MQLALYRSLENISPNEERPRSEPQVSSTEPGPMDISHNNNNNNNATTATKYGEPMESSLSQLSSMGVPGLTQLDTKVGISSDLKPDDENKCFICKVISQFASVFFRAYALSRSRSDYFRLSPTLFCPLSLCVFFFAPFCMPHSLTHTHTSTLPA